MNRYSYKQLFNEIFWFTIECLEADSVDLILKELEITNNNLLDVMHNLSTKKDIDNVLQ